MLERFRRAKAGEIAKLRALEAGNALPRPCRDPRPSFTKSLRARAPGAAVIAEYKRASPSRGDINLGLEPEEAARLYAEAGAGALSVLTEEHHFKGSQDFLARMAGPGLPLLRKDFILDPLQIAYTASTPASALLLIARMLDDDLLGRLLRMSRAFGLEPVVEVFDEADLARAKAAGADIIQVNNRNLADLRVDPGTSARLVAAKEAGEFWITASGIERPEQLADLLGLGFDAALVGSSLMSGPDPGARLRTLLGAGPAAGEGIDDGSAYYAGLRPAPRRGK